MIVYYDDYYLEALFDGVNWVNFTDDVVSDINCEYGIPGTGMLDRVATPGVLSFSLNNTESNSAGLVGFYSPNHPNCRAGFTIGLQVRLTLVFDTMAVQKWTGRIPKDCIKVGTGIYGQRFTGVTVKDWMEQAANAEIQGIAFAENKTMAQGVPLVLAEIDIQPPGTPEYFICQDEFNTLFDMVRSNTTAMAEFAKMAFSELGYIYLDRNGLKIEGRFTRNDEKKSYAFIPKHTLESNYLGTEDGNYLTTEDGRPLVLNQKHTAEFLNSQRALEPSFGKYIYNRVKFTAYPRRVDAAATAVLFNLEKPIKIGASETVVLQGKYKDPNNAASQVSGIDMVTPLVGGTHYGMFVNEDGSGTDLTANLSITPTFGTGGFRYVIENTVATEGWITMLTAVGKGVYVYNAVDYLVEDAASILKNDLQPLTVDMKCQDDPIVANAFAELTLEKYADPFTAIEDASYVANRSYLLAAAFLYVEPGMRVKQQETVAGILNDFFVHRVKFVIKRGGLVHFSWMVKAASLDSYAFMKWDTQGKWDDPAYTWFY